MSETFDFLGPLRRQPATRQQRLLRALVVLIFGSSLVLFALIALNRTRQAESTAAALISHRGEIAKGSLTLFFRPVLAQLATIQALGRHGLIDPTRRDALERIFVPLLLPLDYVGSATIVSSSGTRAYFHRVQGTWSAQFYDEHEDDLVARSWFKGAWSIEALAGVHWDDPRPDDNDATLTASIAWRNDVESATRFAAAFHISRRGVERFIRELPIGEKGEVLLFTREGVVMRMSKALDHYVQLTPRNEFFSTSDEAGENLPHVFNPR